MIKVNISKLLANDIRIASATVGIAVSVSLGIGCSAEPGKKGNPVQVSNVELIASEETRTAFAISKWQVLAAELERVRIIGRDNQGRAAAEFLVAPEKHTSVLVNVIAPLEGVVRVSQEGGVDAIAVSPLREIVAALYRDTGQATSILADPGNDGRIGTVGEALSIAYQGHERMYGGWWGLRKNYNVGGWCFNGGVRDHSSTASDNGASCWVNRWASDQENDCTINLHLGIGAWGEDICHWYVYQNP